MKDEEEKNEHLNIKITVLKEILNFLPKIMYPLIIIIMIYMISPETLKEFINRITSINVFEGTATFSKEIEKTTNINIASEIAPLNSKISELEGKIKIILEDREKEYKINNQIAKKTSKFSENSTFSKNSTFIILVFYRLEQKSYAKKIIEKLLDLGYSSSGVVTDFSILGSRHPKGTIYISHNAKAVSIYKNIGNIVQEVKKLKSIKINTSITDLRRGDMQILLF